MTAMQLKGKPALIAGADLILAARTLGDRLKEVAQEYQARGAQTLHLLADVGDPRQVESVVEQGLNRFGKVDVLACVAAIRPHRPFWEVGDEEWGQVFAINTHSTSSASAHASGLRVRGRTLLRCPKRCSPRVFGARCLSS